jgi:hypothetical protein
MLNESNLCVFLLGSGSSADYGLPVMRDFMDHARRRCSERKSHSPQNHDHLVDSYVTLFAFYERCRASSWAFLRDWENIEDLYTQADLLRLAESAGPGGPKAGPATRAACLSITWAIWDVCRRVEKLIPLQEICQNVRAAGLHPVIIKLHGSVNWFEFIPSESEDAEAGQDWFASGEFGAEATCSATARLDHPAIDIERLNRDLAPHGPTHSEIAAGGIVPAVIPPMLGKASLAPVIASQWRAALSALAAARQIWIMGYSFPPTDAFMSRLLAEGLREHSAFERLYIVDIQDRSQWEPRLASLFNPVFARQRVRFLQQSAGEAHAKMASTAVKNWERVLAG